MILGIEESATREEVMAVRNGSLITCPVPENISLISSAPRCRIGVPNTSCFWRAHIA